MTKNKTSSGPLFKVTLRVGAEQVAESSSDDVTEAVLALSPQSRINGRCYFSLFSQGKTSTVVRNSLMAKRILSNPLMALMTGRALVMQLK
jgi:hypothetical protein